MLNPGLCSKQTGFILPLVILSIKYSQVVMGVTAMNLKDEHEERGKPFFNHFGYAIC